MRRRPNGGGINGSLTPSRKRYTPSPMLSNPTTATSTTSAPQYPSSTNERFPPTWQGGHGGEQWKVGTSVEVGDGDRLAAGAGISLQETEERIRQLERAEFDLKMRLFYTEERLEEAAGGTDAVQLHREVAHAKRHRTQAEESLRAASAAATALHAKCEALTSQVRDLEARRKTDKGQREAVEAANVATIKKHVRLLEDTLRAERAENARLRVIMADPRMSGSYSLDNILEQGGHARRLRSRRKSTGDICVAEPDAAARTAGMGSREQRERRLTLENKVRSQDSSMRSLRAEITTLTRRLRTQAQSLDRQKLELKALTQAAEQVACVEAEEIARLAVELEQAVREARTERHKRHVAEERLADAQQRLARSTANTAGGDHSPVTTASIPLSRATRPRTPSSPPHDPPSPPHRGDFAYAERETENDTRSAGEGHVSALGRDREATRMGGDSAFGDTRSRILKRGDAKVAPTSRVTSSTISSRGRSVTPPRNRDGNYNGVRDRPLTSPRDDGRAAGKDRRRPWGSPPPKPKARRENSLEHTFKPSGSGSRLAARNTFLADQSSSTALTANSTTSSPRGATTKQPKVDTSDGQGTRRQDSLSGREEAKGNSPQNPQRREIRKPMAGRASMGKARPALSTAAGAGSGSRREVRDPAQGSKGRVDPVKSIEPQNRTTRLGGISRSSSSSSSSSGGARTRSDEGRVRKNPASPTASNPANPAAIKPPNGDDTDHHVPQILTVSSATLRNDRQEERVKASGANGTASRDDAQRFGFLGADGEDGSGLDALTLSADLTETVARELRLAVATSNTPTSGLTPEGGKGFPLGNNAALPPSQRRCSAEQSNLVEQPSERRDRLDQKNASAHRCRVGVRGITIANGEDMLVSGRSSKSPRAVSSREVAELESDVHDLFQFFAGRRELTPDDLGEAEREDAEARASATIGHALALFGSASDTNS